MKTIPNTHRVPPKQWKKWSQRAKIVFNDLYHLLRNHQKIFMHPKAAVIPDTHWATIAWNASWEAADATNEIHGSLQRGDVVQDVNGSKLVREHVIQ
jgi:hypothetical protein